MTQPVPFSPPPHNPGNIRVIARVRPVTKEDGEGPEATNAVTFDADDDSIIHLLHKGKPVSFELDKVFSPRASQQDVSVALWGKGQSSGGWGDTQGEMMGAWTERSIRVGKTRWGGVGHWDALLPPLEERRGWEAKIEASAGRERFMHSLWHLRGPAQPQDPGGRYFSSQEHLCRSA